MKRFTVLLIAALILSGSLVDALGSGISNEQSLNFKYNTYSYWAFIHDYTTGLRESNTPGFISYDTARAFANQYTGVHVAYIYMPYFGKYMSAQALRHIVFQWIIYPFPIL